MKFFSVVFALASASAAMSAAVPEPEIPGKLVSRAEFEIAVRQMPTYHCISLWERGKGSLGKHHEDS
ncbi:hypothetical protein F66182_3554 [Fusarium sp. NRRL 66182]|nr:hypothetical protein F66182_3554 [Fusarium sp. NRRL 66182]